MSSLNRATIIGNLTAAPEMRFTQGNTAVCNFSVATNERFKDRNGEQQERTEFHRVVAWGRLAEICNEYLGKGSKVYIEGPLQTQEWEKDGVKRYTTEIKVLTMTMLGNRQGSLDSSGANNAPATNRSEIPNSSPVHDAVDIDDLPFT